MTSALTCRYKNTTVFLIYMLFVFYPLIKKITFLKNECVIKNQAHKRNRELKNERAMHKFITSTTSLFKNCAKTWLLFMLKGR